MRKTPGLARHGLARLAPPLRCGSPVLMVPLVKLVEGLWSPGAGAPAGLALSSIVEGTEAAGEDPPLPPTTGFRITPGLLDTPGSPDALRGFPSRHLQAFAIATASLPPSCFPRHCEGQQSASVLASAQVPVRDETQVWTSGPSPHPVPARGDVSGSLSVLFEWVLILIG